MARPRKPTNILELSGAFKKHPDRAKARINEPKPTGVLGDPPEYFSLPQKAIWAEIIQQVPDGMFAGLDKWILELAVVQIESFRSGELTTMGVTSLVSILSKLGLTPTDRSKVQMPEKPIESKWARHAK